MTIPEFTAEMSLRHRTPTYRHRAGRAESNKIVPSIPSVEGCDQAATQCDPDHPNSLACKILKHCPDRPPRPPPADDSVFVCMARCHWGCSGDKDCTETCADILC
jgi:hypothetical protein